ncbi:MAG: PglZ domain-containing protein, partial [Candidatus Aenigmatarchaeota archaeon]
LNDKFSQEFDVPDIDIESQIGVLDSVKEGTVVFVLDALRYELAHDFDNVQDIKPVLGVLPSKTNLGMASILPGEEEISLRSNGGSLHIEKGERPVTTKGDRVDYLREHGWKVYKSLEKLNSKDIKEISELSKSREKILIYSQTLDLLGENLEEISLSQFNRIIGKAQKKAKRLLKDGVEKILVTTDHGFLYKPSETESEPVPKPEGEIIDSGPRYCFGKKLKPEKNTMVNISDYGINTDLDFVFPPSLGVFSTPGRGRKFLHGGISLQELIIPIVEISRKTSTEDNIKVSISEAPEEVGSPQFKIELKGKQSKLSSERVVRIEVSQYGNKVTKEDIFSPVSFGTTKAIIKLDTSAVENKTGKIKLEVFDDDTNVMLDKKEIDINLIYGDDGL